MSEMNKNSGKSTASKADDYVEIDELDIVEEGEISYEILDKEISIAVGVSKKDMFFENKTGTFGQLLQGFLASSKSVKRTAAAFCLVRWWVEEAVARPRTCPRTTS